MANGSGFSGDVAAYCEQYRRGCPEAVIDAVAARFGLGPDDVVVGLGCGTGRPALPLAARVGAVIGVDPEPDMLRRRDRRGHQRRAALGPGHRLVAGAAPLSAGVDRTDAEGRQLTGDALAAAGFAVTAELGVSTGWLTRGRAAA